VCPTELIAFSDRAAEFKAINTQVIAASTGARPVAPQRAAARAR
jgi:alkyl hydroperoxide reductase subunit AhpC